MNKINGHKTRVGINLRRKGVISSYTKYSAERGMEPPGSDLAVGSE